MTIESLTIHHVRIISNAEIFPAAAVNLIIGPNAAGKTSVLEAIDVLSRGRSFRTDKLERIITTGADTMLVAARLQTSSGQSMMVGLEKSRAGTHIKIQGRDADSIGELATLMPVQALHPESHQLIVGGPAHRRAFVDWGTFHVERDYGALWRRYRRALRQRNAALRAPGGMTAARAWSDELSTTGDAVDEFRRRYLSRALPAINVYCSELLQTSVDLRYQPGWPGTETLRSLLDSEVQRDIDRGHTRFGPHRADLQITLSGRPAGIVASRGQQKLLAAALKLGQTCDFSRRRHRRCLVLIDDLPAELELHYRDRIASALAELHAQVFITAIKQEDVDLRAWDTRRVFDVERGHVQEVI